MKKTMILALAVLGMVLGSFAIVTQVKAQGGPCGPSIESGDCTIKQCGECLYISCLGGDSVQC